MFISHKYKTIFIHIQRTGGNSIQKLFEEADPELIETVEVDPANKRIKHCYAVDIAKAIDPEIFNGYTKFAVVRNPFERMVSWYSMFKHGFSKDDRMVKVEARPRLAEIYYQGVNRITDLKFSKRDWLFNAWDFLFQRLPMDSNSANSQQQVAIRFAQTGTNIMLAIEQDASTFEEFISLPPEHADGLFSRFYVNQLDYISSNDKLLVDRVLRLETLTGDFNALANEIGLDTNLEQINSIARKTHYRNYYTTETKELVSKRFQRDLDYFGYEF